MRKIKKRISMLIAFSLLLSMFIPTSALAATYSLSATTTTKTQKLTSTSTWYKISCPGEGYVTISISASGFDSSVYVYDSYKNEIRYVYITERIPVSKGYIYVKANYLSDYNPNGFTYKFTAITQKTNYCKGRAYTLARDKKINIFQTPSYTFKRWFKITTTQTQSIKIYVKGSSYMTLYNSKGQQINLNCDYNTNSAGYYTYKTTSLAKGTYYLTCGGSEETFNYSCIYWK